MYVLKARDGLSVLVQTLRLCILEKALIDCCLWILQAFLYDLHHIQIFEPIPQVSGPESDYMTRADDASYYLW